MKNNILIINGPNLELLGTREPEIYGKTTLGELNESLRVFAENLEMQCEFFQSNIEGEIINVINGAKNIDAIIINAAAYTHTSIAIMDSLKNFAGYIVEVHISNPHAREEFRRQSFISKVANVVISGAGCDSYKLAIQAVSNA